MKIRKYSKYKKNYCYAFCECGKSLPKRQNNKSKICGSCASKKRPKINRKHEKEIKREEILSLTELLVFFEEINETINNLNGIKGTRNFYKKYPLIYKNIYYYTKEIKNYNLYERIQHLKLGGKDKYILYPKGSLIHYMTINGPIKGYINIRKDNPSYPGKFSYNWYKKKYPNDYEERYKKRYEKIINNTPYSKISQKLFDKIDINGAWYATKNKEMSFYLSEYNRKKFDLNQTFIKIDFLYKNKIIEFDGDYWHKKTKEKDKNKDSFLQSLGYKILRIKESNYKNNPQKEIKKCINFLKNH